jgi:group I intron endonuclease
MTCGIYCIENLVNGKKYIGKSFDDIEKNRWYNHKNMLRRSVHGNKYLQNSWNKYGEENFKFWIVEEHLENDEKKLGEIERKYIKEWNTRIPNGYNLTDGGEGISGYKHTDESREKMRISQLNRNPEITERMRKTLTGRKMSEEMKKKLAGTRKKGRIVSEETKQKLRITNGNNAKERTAKSRASFKPKYGTDNIQYGRKLSTSKSKYFGVFPRKRKPTKKNMNDVEYIVSISENRKSIHIGLCQTEIVAAVMYDDYIIKNEINRPLNFPENYTIEEKKNITF